MISKIKSFVQEWFWVEKTVSYDIDVSNHEVVGDDEILILGLPLDEMDHGAIHDINMEFEKLGIEAIIVNKNEIDAVPFESTVTASDILDKLDGS